MYLQDLEFYIITQINKKQCKDLLNLINYNNKSKTIKKIKEYSKNNNLELIFNICNNLLEIESEYKQFLTSLESYIFKWWC